MAEHDRSGLHAALAELRRSERDSDTSMSRVQRGCARFAVEAEGWLHRSARAGGLETSIPVLLKDISRCGAGVIANRPVDICDAIPLAICDGSLTVATLSTFVRHCRRVGVGEQEAYLVGLDFGVDASVLTALGVSPLDILRGDQMEANELSNPDSFCAPEQLGDADAA